MASFERAERVLRRKPAVDDDVMTDGGVGAFARTKVEWVLSRAVEWIGSRYMRGHGLYGRKWRRLRLRTGVDNSIDRFSTRPLTMIRDLFFGYVCRV